MIRTSRVREYRDEGREDKRRLKLSSIDGSYMSGKHNVVSKVSVVVWVQLSWCWVLLGVDGLVHHVALMITEYVVEVLLVM